MSDDCVIKVSSGYLRGLRKKTSLNLKDYFSFLGIPYAEPPVGINRFKDPVPIGNWEGIRDATKHGEVCPQYYEKQKKVIGNEDCLFLNVYSPKIPDNNSVPSFPVMVFIHGGGFTFGSGNSETYGPDYLVERDIVLVTINYRVAVFGFLSLGNSDVPGNAGLKDQNLALRWIQENIKYFGGNPANVTLFGESAGASSAHFHTMSPLSSGLFHRVILQSGCALNQWSFYENPINRAFILGELLGKKTTNIDELVKFLRDQPSEILVSNQTKVLTSDEQKKLSFPFVPCKEITGTGSNFLTECPEKILKSKQFSEVPFMIGITDKEGMIMLKENTILELGNYINDPQRLLPIDLCNSECRDDIAKKVKKFYFSELPISVNSLDDFVNLSTDLEFLVGINKTLRYLLARPSIPIHLYLFTFEGKLAFLKPSMKLAAKNVPRGVCHADELGYLFHNHNLFLQFPVDSGCKEIGIIDKFCTFWTNYAKSSDPNDERYEIKWNCYKSGSPCYIEINDVLECVKTDLFPDRKEFWENIYASLKLS